MTRPGVALPESRWTAASQLCPHPENWSSTDDDSTEVEVSEMLAGLVRALQPEVCVETGAAWGQTAMMIGQALRANGHGHLVSFETDPERVLYAADRCDDLPVEIRQMASLEGIVEGPIEFAFFDSLFPLRSAEFSHFRPSMRPGTVVAFHDSAPGHGGGQFPDRLDLRGDLERLASISGLRIIHLPTPRGITIGEVSE